jgi:hypothetical protein
LILFPSHDPAAQLLAIFPDLLVLLAMNSDRATMNLGYLEYGMIPSKVGDLQTSIDNIWSFIARRTKINFLDSGVVAQMSGHESYLENYFTWSLLDGTDLEWSIERYSVGVPVSGMMLALARRLSGITKVERNGQTFHYFALWNMVSAGSVLATDHGDTVFYSGLNTAMGLQYFYDKREMPRHFKAAVENRKHWTWTDLKDVSDHVDFKFKQNLAGISDPSIYWGMRRHFRYTTAPNIDNSAATGSNWWITLVSGTTTIDDLLYSSAVSYGWGTNSIAQNTPSFWALMFLLGYFEDYYRLYIGADVTADEVALDLLIGLLVDGNNVLGNSDKIASSKMLHLVEMVDAHDYERKYGLAVATSVQLRFGNVGNVYDQSLSRTYRIPFEATIARPPIVTGKPSQQDGAS